MQIAIDIGGTFTDVVGIDGRGELAAVKVPTQPGRLADSVLDGMRRLLVPAGRAMGEVSRFVHGTTIATNAVLERKGAATGILMTEGFEDTLEIGRQIRSRMYDLFCDAETPTFLSPRRMRVGIPERMAADGSVLTPLDEVAVRRAARLLAARFGVRAIAVCYLFSFRNPAHELRTREILREECPGVSVSLSCELNPTFREYERVVVTAFDAYVRPVVEAYARTLEGELRGAGMRGPVQLMNSRGTITSFASAYGAPVTMLLSGPAAGAVGGRFLSAEAGLGDVITLDMGGTSCDVALIRGGREPLHTEGRIERYPLRLPMLDVTTIGAGGGSLAWLDETGGLRVGPQSAGADPGPACYGRGGTEPTVTDASLELGYLNPTYFAGGAVVLDPGAATRALRRVGDKLGLDPVALAAGIHRIINAKMADQIRLVSVLRGHDPRRFTLVAFGGAGPVQAAALAAPLGIPRVLVPAKPGVLSAFGLLAAEVEHYTSRTFAVSADGVDLATAQACFARLEAEGLDKMRGEGVPLEAVRVERLADMRYVGQSYELEVALPGDLVPASLSRAVAAFHDRHEAIYGHGSPEAPVEFINLKVRHSFAYPPPAVRRRPSGGGGAAAKGRRRAFFAEAQGFVETPVFERDDLPAGWTFTGPAIVEQPDSTTVIPPGWPAVVDARGNLILSVGA